MDTAFTAQTLIPGYFEIDLLGPDIKHVTEPVPLRPFFLSPHATVGNTGVATASGFYQNIRTKTSGGTFSLICGHKLYRRSDWTEEWDDPDTDPVGNHATSGTRTGWGEYDPDDGFALTAGGDPAEFAHRPGGDSAIDNFDRYEGTHRLGGEHEHIWWEEKTTTYTGEITRADLASVMADWAALTLAVRSVSDTNAATAYQRTTTEGGRAMVQPAYYRYVGSTVDDTPEGMVGDISTLFGIFSARLARVERFNAPTIYRERARVGSELFHSSLFINAYYGNYVFEPCPAEKIITLEEECTGTWRDAAGEYPWDVEANSAGDIAAALAPVGWTVSEFYQDMLYAMSSHAPSALLFVARNGSQYRITIHQTYGDEFPEAVIQLVTDPDTLRAEWAVPFAPDFYGWYELSSIEQNTGTPGDPEWTEVARNYPWWEEPPSDPLPDPDTIIGNAVTDGKPLFGAYKVRQGSIVGHPGFTDSSTRFRIRRTTYQTTGEPTSTSPDERCGAGYPAVSLSYNIIQRYDMGTLDYPDAAKPNAGYEVVSFSRTVGGQPWLMDNAQNWVHGYLINEGATHALPTSIVSNTERSGTRNYGTGTYDANPVGINSFSLAWDRPDPQGAFAELPSTVELAVSIAGGIYRSTEQYQLPPAEGRAVFGLGTRPTYPS